MKVAVLVTLEMPEGKTRQEVADFIKDAVTCYNPDNFGILASTVNCRLARPMRADGQGATFHAEGET